MEQFQFRCRAVGVEHRCAYGKEAEPTHSPELSSCVADTIKATEEMEFDGTIKSSANNYQVSLDFDDTWVKRMTGTTAWQDKPLAVPADLLEIPGIQPDCLLAKNGTTVVVEIEKANKKTIWFDIIKILMLIGEQAASAGLLLVPRNYAHRRGEWNLFNDARFYRSCLIRFAKVNPELLSKLAIVGYTQEVLINGNWARLDKAVLSDIKERY